jgi:hypothetical protein
MEGTKLKAMNKKMLPKPVKMAFRNKDKQAKYTGDLLRWIKDLNPGISSENLRILYTQLEPNRQRLIVLVQGTRPMPVKIPVTKSSLG